MRTFLSFLLAAPLFLCAAHAGAPSWDFDRSAGLPPVVQRAAELPVPAATTPDGAGDSVWISMARPDVAALDGALFKRAPAAQNDKVAIYEMKLSEVDQISEGMQRTFRRSPGFFAHDTLEAALQDLSEPPAAAAKAFTIDQGPVVKALLKLVKEEPVVAAISSLASFKNRYYRSATGIESSKWLAGHWKELAAGRPDMSVTTFKHAAFPQESVILTVRGTTEPDKVVVVGGHLDSTAGGSDSPAPGADDNASGIAVTEELIRVLAASGHKPAQTLKFIAFAAEEAGLRGSGEIAAAFKKDGVAVQGMLNLDMANYKGSPADIYFVSDNTSAEQNAFIGKLISTYTDYTWGTTKCGYGCSDHASWTRNGFAASLPFESTFADYNPAIHSANDTLAQTGGRAEHAVKFARLGVAYIVEMAK